MSTGIAAAFRQSQHCKQDCCVQIGEFRKSTYSNTGRPECVEVGERSDSAHAVVVQDSAQSDVPGRSRLVYSPAAWRRFVTHLRGAGSE